MSPIEIGPDGSPIVKKDDPPSTSEPIQSLPQLREVLREESAQKRITSKEEYLKEMRDIVRRYTSDSQSYEKCVAELSALLPDSSE